MVFRITPSLGPQVDELFPTSGPYWDNQLAGISIGGVTIEPSYKLGSVVRGSDGGEYIFVRASAAIANTANTGTQVALTRVGDGYTVATGSGGFWTPPGAVAIGEYIHVRRGAWNAIPA